MWTTAEHNVAARALYESVGARSREWVDYWLDADPQPCCLSTIPRLCVTFAAWTVPRSCLEVTVGNEVLATPFTEQMAFMLRSYLVADREALLSQPRSAEPPPSFQTSVEIEGDQVVLDAYGSAAERWVGLGKWREISVFVHAIDIRPERIRLRVTEQIH